MGGMPKCGVVDLASIFPALLILYIRYYLVTENKRRDALAAAGKDFQNTGVVESADAEGHHVETAVDNNQLDLADRENLTFRYVS